MIATDLNIILPNGGHADFRVRDGSFALYTYISPILLQMTKISESAASLLMLGYGVMAAIGNVWGGRLADHRAPMRP